LESVGVSVKRRLPWVISGLIVYLVIIPFIFRHNGYWLTTFINASILGFISLGVWLTFSIGRINICQSAFALIGGYTLAILSTRYAVPFWLAVPASGLVSAILGFIIGWPILRLRGVYFAMLTLSLTEATRLATLNFKGLTEGASGIINIPTPFTTGNTYLAWYFFTAILVVLGVFVIYRITTCRLG
jgi:branched-chain amino acid transport system permease protein